MDSVSVCTERERRITNLENALLELAFLQEDSVTGHDVFNAIKKAGIKFSKSRLRRD